jgi:hypothetical protein
MAVTTDIVATYRGPGAVVRRLLARGESEPRALAYAMAGCFVLFVAGLPALARKAHLTGSDLQMDMGGALLGTVFILPLALYVVAAVAHGIARGLGGRGTAHGARVALFWALLASGPLILLNGLVAGFIGPGGQQTIVGAVWFAVFMWFWLGGMRAVQREAS